MQAQAAMDPFQTVAALPGVAEQESAARDAIDRLRRHRVLRRQAGQVAAESGLRGARASASLAGVEIALDELRHGAPFGLDADAEGQALLVAQGCLRAASAVGTLVPVWRVAPLQAVARLHTLVAVGQVADDELGRPHPSGADRLAALGALASAPTSASGFVVAAVVHAELATMGAFPVGSGVVARAADRVVSIAAGVDPGAVSVPEVGHLEIGRVRYDEALAGYLAGGSEGIVAWIAHCAKAVELGAREGMAICESIARGTHNAC